MRARRFVLRCLVLLLGLSVAVALLAGAGGARADSVFSARGLGEVVTPADVRARGMGGVAVAVPDPWNLSRANPALLVPLPGLVVYGELRRELLHVEDANGEVRSPRSTNFPLFRLAVPVPRVGVVGLGVAQYTDVSYEFRRVTSAGGDRITEILRGQNGLDLLGLTWARRVHPKVDAGIDLDFLLGSYIDVWEHRFDDPLHADSVDSLIVNHSRGPILRLGVTGAPHQRLRLGAALTFGRDIDLRPEIRSTGNAPLYPPRRTLHLPVSLALGASGDIDPHWRAAADLVHTHWESTDLTLGTDPAFDRSFAPTVNVTRVAFGVEYQGDRAGESRRLRDRMPLRAGYAWEPWHFRDAAGEKITDHFVTAGFGVPVKEGAGMIQFAFELGFRGDREKNGARERVLRFGVGLAAKERVLVGKVPDR